MKVHDHGEGQPRLNDRRNSGDFVKKEDHPRDRGHAPASRTQGESERAVHGLGEESHFNAKLRHARFQVDVAAPISEIGQAAPQRTRGGANERRGKRAQKCDRQEAELEAGVE